MIEKIKGTSKKIAGSRKFQTALLFAPGFTIYALLILLSIVLCFYYSLFDWDGVKNTMNFVGFFNYIKALADPALRGSLKVTFFFAILGTAFVNIVAMTISVQLSKPGILTNFYRSAFFFPQLISLVAIGFIFKSLLSYIGIINTIFAKWDFPLIDFLGSPDLAKWTPSLQNTPSITVLFVSVWQISGFGTILYLAGLQAIPPDLYAAAKVDGANAWQRFRSITFPWLAPSFTSVTVFIFTGYMRMFDFPFVLTGGGPVNSTESIAILVIRIGFNQYKISYASAISIYFLIIVAAVSVTMTYLLRRREESLVG